MQFCQQREKSFSCVETTKYFVTRTESQHVRAATVDVCVRGVVGFPVLQRETCGTMATVRRRNTIGRCLPVT